MTENEKLVRDETEAIECLKSNKPTSGYLMLQESIDMAIKALEEVQQYRDTTLSPEQVRTLTTRFADVSLLLGEYMAIVTPEECREAITKERTEH